MTGSAFKTWGPDHAAVLLFVFLVSAWMIADIKALRRKSIPQELRTQMGFFILFVGIVDWVQRFMRGHYLLPLHLCDIALILAFAAWLRPRRRGLGELVVMWALSGSLQAMLTPDLSEGFPSISWFFFFGAHLCVFLSAMYFLCSGEVRLSLASVNRVSLWSIAYLIFIGAFNKLFHFNYGYLLSKPAHPSLLDHLGPWPYYIAAEALLAVGLFFLILGFGTLVQARAARSGC